jgi:hypothetical protein
MKSFNLQFSDITIDAKNSILENLKTYIFIKTSILHFKKSITIEKKSISFSSIPRKFKYSKIKPKATVKPINHKDVNSYVKQIANEKVNDSIFVFNMDIFENWILDLIRIKLKKYPKSYGTKQDQEKELDQKVIPIKIIKESGSVEEIWEKIIGDYIFKMGYKDILKHLELLYRHYGIKINRDDLVGKINEYSLRRNLVVHNNKIVNEIYLRKSGKSAVYNIGDKVSVLESDLYEQTDILLRFMTDFQVAFKSK